MHANVFRSTLAGKTDYKKTYSAKQLFGTSPQFVPVGVCLLMNQIKIKKSMFLLIAFYRVIYHNALTKRSRGGRVRVNGEDLLSG